MYWFHIKNTDKIGLKTPENVVLKIFLNIFRSAIGKLISFSIFAPPKFQNADVAKLVDALDLGSSAARRGGSTPSIRTKETVQKTVSFLF